MSTSFVATIRGLLAGKSIARIRMEYALAAETLYGRVVDVGGGSVPAEYLSSFKKKDVTGIDSLDGRISGIDFEKDQLPYADGSVDTIVACNVLEHIYNHTFLLKEMHRTLRAKGVLIGFVPFWVGYHPDPHDYFRYTREALKRLLEDADFTEVVVREVGGSPILANFNTTMLSMPRIARVLVYLLVAPIDALFVHLRPESRKRNPLGYVFSGVKKI